MEKKRCRYNTVILSILFLVIALSYSSICLAEQLIGIVNGGPIGEPLKISIVNNNKECTGICTKTINTDGYFDVSLDYKINDTLTIYTYYKDVLNTNTEAATEIPYNIRLSVCNPPEKPMLYEIKEVHDTKTELSWLSENSEYTALSIDGSNYYETESPHIADNLNEGNHTWSVKACANGCCAKEVTSSFIVKNNAPTKPEFEMTEQGLQIKKGTDTDKDSTYVEYKINDGPEIKSEHFDINNMQIAARTCDPFSCSEWITQKINSCSNNNINNTTKTGGSVLGLISGKNPNANPDTFESQSNYSMFLSDIRNLLSEKTNLDPAKDISCTEQMSQGVSGIKEILTAKISEASSFMINTNVPQTVRVGEEISILIDFKANKMYENLSFKVLSPLNFTSKNIDILVDNEQYSTQLVASTKGLKEGNQIVTVRVTDFQGTVYNKEFTIKLIYTLNDFEYQLQELRVQSRGVVDFITNFTIIISAIIVSITLFLYMRLKQKFSKELISEAKLKKDRDLALSMLNQKNDVDALKKDTLNQNVQNTQVINIDKVKEDATQKTEYEKHLEKLEETRNSYLQRDDERKNNYV